MQAEDGLGILFLFLSHLSGSRSSHSCHDLHFSCSLFHRVRYTAAAPYSRSTHCDFIIIPEYTHTHIHSHTQPHALSAERGFVLLVLTLSFRFCSANCVTCFASKSRWSFFLLSFLINFSPFYYARQATTKRKRERKKEGGSERMPDSQSVQCFRWKGNIRAPSRTRVSEHTTQQSLHSFPSLNQVPGTLISRDSKENPEHVLCFSSMNESRILNQMSSSLTLSAPLDV